MNNDLGGIWKKVVVAYFKVLSRHLSGGLEEKHEKLKSG
jgi:hypothetical protein